MSVNAEGWAEPRSAIPGLAAMLHTYGARYAEGNAMFGENVSIPAGVGRVNVALFRSKATGLPAYSIVYEDAGDLRLVADFYDTRPLAWFVTRFVEHKTNDERVWR